VATETIAHVVKMMICNGEPCGKKGRFKILFNLFRDDFFGKVLNGFRHVRIGKLVIWSLQRGLVPGGNLGRFVGVEMLITVEDVIAGIYGAT